MRKSPITDVSDLAAYSNEHVVYEVQMFRCAVDELVADSRNRPERSLTTTTTTSPVMTSWKSDASWFTQMARIEALVLHYRNLIVFLFPDVYTVLGDDIVAPDFISRPDPDSIWMNARGPIPADLKAWKTRADKELAHLTSRRQSGAGPTKAWPARELAEGLAEILARFLAAADEERLGEGASRTIAAFVEAYEARPRRDDP